MISKQGIARATLILIFATLVSRIFGFFREVVIAGTFGASATTDAFFVALTIPVLFSDFIKYSVKNSFVPVFSHYRLQQGDPAAVSFTWRFTKLVGLGFVILSFILFFSCQNLISLIAPGLTESANVLAVRLMKFLSFLVILLGLASVFESIYNGFEHFITPAFTPLVLNVTVICAILLYAETLGTFSIVLGILLGGVLQLLILSRILRVHRFCFRGKLHFTEPELKKVFNLGTFIFIIQAMWGAYLVVDRILASSLQEGSISALSFADKLIQLPVGVFVLALSIAVLPQMSISVAKRNYRRVERICSTGLRMLLFVIVPVTILFCIVRLPLVRVLYQRGSFDIHATVLTAGPVFAYSLGLCAFAGQIFILRVYFAFQDLKTPLVTGLISFGIKVVLSLVLLKVLAATGIALATSIAASCNTVLLAGMLVRKRYLSTVFGTWRGLDKLCIGWLLFAGAGIFTFRSLDHATISSRFLSDVIQIGATVIAGCIVYVGILGLLRADEIAKIKEVLWSRDTFQFTKK